MLLTSISIDSSPAQDLKPEPASTADASPGTPGAAGDSFSLRLGQALDGLPQGQKLATDPGALTSVALGPTFEVITAGADGPDGKSLAAFATAQGLDPEVVAWLFTEGGEAGESGQPGESGKPGDTAQGEAMLDGALQSSALLPLGLFLPPSTVPLPASIGGKPGNAPDGTAGGQNAGLFQVLEADAGLAPATSWVGQWAAGVTAEAGAAQARQGAQNTVPDAAGSFAAAQALASAGLLAQAAGKTAGDTGKLDVAPKGIPIPVEVLSLDVDPFALSLIEKREIGEAQAPDAAASADPTTGNPAPITTGAASGAAGQGSAADAASEAQQTSSAQHRAEALHNLAQRLGEAVGQRVLAQIARGNWSMKLMLKPATLGDVEVDLRMRSGELDAAFRAFNPMTRELLADGLPRLREVLSGAGMDIAGLQVGHGSSQSAGGNPTPQQSLPVVRREETGGKALSGPDAVASPSATSVRRSGSANWDVLV